MVICHERKNMTTSTSATLIRFETTDDKVSEKACCAPMTSLLRRLINAPVWVRVKKARGIRWMCANTWDRMSKMRPSPTFAETHRIPILKRVSMTATAAATRDKPMTSCLSCFPMPSLMIDRKRSGLMTPTTASMTTRTRNQMRIVR